MTTVESLSRQLCRRRDDLTLRGVLADALDEAGLALLAEGYRALAATSRRPAGVSGCWLWYRWSSGWTARSSAAVATGVSRYCLPRVWWDALAGWAVRPGNPFDRVHRVYRTVRAAEDAAALAYASLSLTQKCFVLSPFRPEEAV